MKSTFIPLFMLAGAPLASASLLTYTFEGALTTQLPGTFPRYKIGDTFTMSATIDTDATPISYGPYLNSFVNNQTLTDFSFTLTNGSYVETFSLADAQSAPGSRKIGIKTTPSPSMGIPTDSFSAGISIQGDHNIFAGTAQQSSNYFLRSITIMLEGPVGTLTPGPGGQWPLFPESLSSGWAGYGMSELSTHTSQLSLNVQQNTGGALDLYGEITSMSVGAVPEPSTYGLVGAGAIAAGAMLRRRRRR